MLRVWRYLWVSTVALLSLLLILLFTISQLDLNRFKDTIETQVTELTGRQLTINGSLQVDFSLQPMIRIEKVSFANAPWGKQPQMLSLKLLQLKIRLLPLLKSKLVVEQLLLDGVEISIETNKDGQMNWQLKKFSSEEEVTDSEPVDLADFQLPILPVLEQIEFNAIHIDYSDATAGIETDTVIEQLRLNNHGIDEAIIFSANGTVNQQPFNFSGKTSFMIPVATKNLADHSMSIQLNADALGLKLAASGTIERPIVAEGIDIKLSLDADDLDKSFTAATGQSIYQYLKKSKQPFALKLSAGITDINDGYAFNNIEFKLAENDLNGELSFVNHPDRPEFIAKIHSDNINLNQLLPEETSTVQNNTVQEKNSEPKKLKAGTNKSNPNKKEKSGTLIDLPDTTLPFDLLETLDAKVEYSIRQFQYEKLNPQSIIFNASLSDGLLQVKQFDLKLEGAPIQSSLTIDSRTKTPLISTDLETDGLKLNLISQQFQIEQIRTSTLNSKIELSTEGDNIKSLVFNLAGKANIQLDDNDISGDFSILNNHERPKIVANLHSKKIDVNKFFSRKPQKPSNSEIKKPVAKDNKSLHAKNQTNESIIELPDSALPFDLLKIMDAELNYSIKQFQLDEFDPQEIKFDAHLDDGLLQVKQFDFNLEGTPIRSSLTIDSRSKKPRILTSFDVDRFQLNTISQQLNIKQIKSGTLTTKANLKSSGKSIKSLVTNLNGKADIQLADVNLEQELKDKNHIVDIEQLHLVFSGIGEPFNYEVTATVDDKPLSLSGYLDSPAAIIENKNFNIKLKLAALKAQFDVEGSIVNPQDIGTAQLDFALYIPSIHSTNREIYHFIPKIKPPKHLADLPVSIKGKLISTPNTYRINDILLKAGNNDLFGNIYTDLRGEIPFIEANLESHLIDLNEILPETKLEDSNTTQKSEGTAAAPEKNKPVKTRLFSDKPLPALDVLNKFNINLKYTQKKLISNEQIIDNILLNLTLKDGLLKLDPISIEFAKGTIKSKLELSDTDKIHFRFEDKVNNLDYGDLLTILGMKEYAKGKLNAETNLTGEGNSVSEIMSSLNGKVRVTTVDGVLDTDSLKFLSKDIVSLIPFTDTSNRQKINCGVLQFDINDGIAATHSMVVNTGALSALGTSNIDLGNETYSLYVAPRSKRTSVLQVVLVPVNITGPLSTPTVKPDITGTTISTTKTYTNISLTIATGGIWLLAEGVTNKLWDKFIDDTDYCARALAGDKIVPRRINLAEEEKKIAKEEKKDLADLLDDDENDW